MEFEIRNLCEKISINRISLDFSEQYLLVLFSKILFISEVLKHDELVSLNVETKRKYFDPIGTLLVRDFIFSDNLEVIPKEETEIIEIYDQLENAISSIISICDQAGVSLEAEEKNWNQIKDLFLVYKSYLYDRYF